MARNLIFVFGSNLAGRHGAGAAKHALQYHGATYGRGIGIQGNSYAIPTKDCNLRTLPLNKIKHHVSNFIAFAKVHPELNFKLTRIGCGLAGYTDQEITALLPSSLPQNVLVPPEWADLFRGNKSWMQTEPNQNK